MFLKAQWELVAIRLGAIAQGFFTEESLFFFSSFYFINKISTFDTAVDSLPMKERDPVVVHSKMWTLGV